MTADNERMQKLEQELKIAMRRAVFAEKTVDHFREKLDQANKTITEFHERIHMMGEVGLRNDDLKERLTDLRTRLTKANRGWDDSEEERLGLLDKNALMLSALEQITDVKICCGCDDDFGAIQCIARDAIAQVNTMTVSQRAVSTDSEVTSEQP